VGLTALDPPSTSCNPFGILTVSRVVVAMSGGVDSSVAAALLHRQGHDVIGLFMRHGQVADLSCDTTPGDPTRQARGCCSEADAVDARLVADTLGIPFYAVNFELEFGRIVDYFVQQYSAGRTPNPCIVCNTWLKFGKLLEYADGVGAQFVATGHYARLVAGDEGGGGGEAAAAAVRGDEPRGSLGGAGISLRRGLDPSKDQSYVLFGIRRELLPRLKFPVGEYRKEEIRRMAERLALPVAAKRDSQEICFVPDGNHARFVRQHRGGEDTSGDIVTTDGQVVGQHDGVERFTIGQRKGLGVAFGQPRYVVRIDPELRRVVVGTKQDLARPGLTASEANWLVDPPKDKFRCHVKIRYRSTATEATVEPLSGGRFRVDFDEPCSGVAPGQAAVCYLDDRVLGGGWIE